MPPQIIQFPEDQKVRAGEPVELLGKVTGTQPITCTWMKFRKQVSRGGKGSRKTHSAQAQTSEDRGGGSDSITFHHIREGGTPVPRPEFMLSLPPAYCTPHGAASIIKLPAAHLIAVSTWR